MRDLPNISTYGEYDNPNYGLNALQVDLGSIQLYYSYKTIVAYYDAQDGLVVSQNVWSTTTGKHLSWILWDKKSRVPFEKFQVMLQAALERHIK